MTSGARRWSVAMALALLPTLLAGPSHAETPAPTTSAPSESGSPSATTETEPPPAPPSSTATESSPAVQPVAPPPGRATTSRVTSSRATASAPGRATAKSGRWVSLRLNSGRDTKVFTRENFWLRGRVLTTRGHRHARAKVKIYRDTAKGRTKVATVRTSKNGRYIWSPDKPRPGKYRAVVSKVRYSGKVTVHRTTGRRTLASRERSLPFLLGARKGGLQQAGSVRWRAYAKGILVQRGHRTWLVRGPVVRKVRTHGGPGGDLGAPTGDIRCGLPEGGCLQQFRTGAVYVNKKAKKRLTSAVAPKLGAADLVAVARSQVGYREPKPRQSKYNKWIKRTGRHDPWCGYFVSWLAHAGGKPGSIIKAKSFGALLKAERARGRTTKQPRVGRLAYIGYFSKGTVSHVGIVTKVAADHVWTIEGNVSSGGGMNHPRGVHIVKRHKSNVIFYADPRY